VHNDLLDIGDNAIGAGLEICPGHHFILTCHRADDAVRRCHYCSLIENGSSATMPKGILRRGDTLVAQGNLVRDLRYVRRIATHNAAIRNALLIQILQKGKTLGQGHQADEKGQEANYPRARHAYKGKENRELKAQIFWPAIPWLI